jgi:arylsulfatase A-like enzyme
LTSGVSLYVAFTSNFVSVPEIHNAPIFVAKERKLDEGKVPWKIREVKPGDVKPNEETSKPQVEDHTLHISSATNSNETEKKVSDTEKQADEKNEPPKKSNETEPESPNQQAKQSNNDQARDSQNKKKPLNILLLYGDDWRHDSMGSASGGLVKTPFLDNLATQGTRFTHNCVTTSVCWVSRATLYTGQYVSRHKSTEPIKPEFYKGWNQTFPYLLREAGYYFGHVGKWHFKDYAEFVKPQLDWERFYYGRHWFQERDGPIHTTKKNERDALAFLRERPKDKPFCLTVCFFTPHAWDGNPEQFLPQNESLALYVNDTIPLAPSATEEAWKKMPKFFTDRNEGRNRYFWRFDTPEKHQKMMKNYYRLISEIDETSGKIVKELEDQGVLDETLIIFTTDNGFFHAEHGLADKWYPYQESIRVPLIVRDPRMAKDKIGKLNDDFTLSIDLAPTILGAAGLPTPDVMHGQDFSPLYTEEGDSGSSWRQEFFYEHPVHLKESIIPASEALVRKDHKYILWPNYDVEQLFDLKNDTYELNDLIDSVSHKELLNEMRTRFNELKKIAK